MDREPALRDDQARVLGNAHHDVQVPCIVRVMVPPVSDLVTTQLPPIPAGAVVLIDAQTGDSDYRKLSMMGLAIETECGAIACLIGLLRDHGIIVWHRSPEFLVGQTFPVARV